MKTGTLSHAGVMVNYECNAACRHCLYSCSPTRRPGYVSKENSKEICSLLRKGGCRSVHIGGGEPFLDFEGLLQMARDLKEAGIKLEYTETNAFWLEELSDEEVTAKLKLLKKEAADCYCISIDPFHAEYIPYGLPLRLAKLCSIAGVNYFLWRGEYISMLSALDPEKTHSRNEIESKISKSYIFDTAESYGIGYGGRAINIERERGAAAKTIDAFAAEKSPCHNLLSTGHFHVDLDCYFIPPRCTGIKIPLKEAIDGIPEGKYPVFEALYKGGCSALLDIALKEGFIPGKSTYPSKCSLCFSIRHYLSEKNYAELDKNHYEEAIKYYS